jgi:signal transduction histidine kinase
MDARPAVGMTRRLTPRLIDGLVIVTAAALAALPLALAAVNQADVTVSFAMVPIAAGALWWRRSHPLPVLVITGAAFAVAAVTERVAPNGVAVLFAVYAAALYGDGRTRRLGAIVSAATLTVAFGTVLTTGTARALGHLALLAFGFGTAFVLGTHARTHRAYVRELQERAARSEQDRHEDERRAAAAERARIARDLHDAVTHHVSVIAVLAGAARTTAADDPARAADTLVLIEQTARDTLAELRSLLGVLRRTDESPPPPPRRPNPTLADLDLLVNAAREAGVRVDLNVEGDPRPLPAVIDLGAHRLIQEALTNVIKHAPGADATVTMHTGPRTLTITVTDTGRNRTPARTGASGQGLIGMRERVTAAGGELRAGPLRGGGFRVKATFPLDECGAVDRSRFP